MERSRLVTSLATLGLLGGMVGMTFTNSSSAAAAPVAGRSACTRTIPMKPAVGFNPRLGSTAQLHAHDFPLPPPSADRRVHRIWVNYVSMYLAGKARISELCSATEKQGKAIAEGAYPWTGCFHNASFTDVEAAWVVPSATGSPGSDSAHWVGVGLGQTATTPLVQAGVVSPANMPAYAWTEVFDPAFPINFSLPVTGLSNIADHYMMFHVAFQYNGAVGIHIIDESTGRNYFPQDKQSYPGMHLGGHAEVVSEDPNDICQPLADFVTCGFYASQAASKQYGWQYIGSAERPALPMTMTDSNNNVMAFPGGIDPFGDFATYWRRAV